MLAVLQLVALLPLQWYDAITMLLKERILVHEGLILAEYASGFNLSVLLKKPTLEEAWKYVRDECGLEAFKPGSSRTVFKVSDRLVLKLANLEDGGSKGETQNQTEQMAFSRFGGDVLTRVYAYHPKFWWIFAERVDEFKFTNEFQAVTGFYFQTFGNVVMSLAKNRYSIDITLDDAKQEVMAAKQEFERDKSAINLKKKDRMEARYRLLDSPLMMSLLAVMKGVRLLPKDVSTVGHWGKTKDGRAVLLDYGFNDDAYEKHYS